MRKRTVLMVGIVLALILSLVGQAVVVSAQPPEMAKVLIAFDRQPGPAEEGLVRGAGGTVSYTYHLVPAIAASVPQAAIAGLSRNPSVLRVEPDIEAYAIGQTIPWGVERIGAPDVHDAGNEGSGIKVAILDTGIDTNHPDLTFSGGKRFYTTGIIGRSDNNYSDVNGHGTHVAGTVAALNNSIGVIGVAPEVSLYAVKVLGDNGSGSYSNIIAGIQWAVDNGMDITNNSYGSAVDPGLTVKQAYDNAYNAGVLHVAAAGNEYGSGVIYPAKYASVIAVSATTTNGTLATFSSVGPEVELAAPGASIYSTYAGGSYATLSGTSMASPHAAGAAALVWAANPGWTNVQVRTQLQATADDLGLAWNQQGHGLVNAAAAAGVGTTPPETTPTYTLTMQAPEGQGTVTPSVGDYTYTEGTLVELTATPASGWVFDYWDGDVADSTRAETTITMDVDKTVKAVFAEATVIRPETVSVSSITYATSGGRNQDKHMQVTVAVEDSLGNQVTGAAVSIDLNVSSGGSWTFTGTTGTNGTVTFSLNNAPSGTYTTTVTSVTASGLTWDEETPDNSFSK